MAGRLCRSSGQMDPRWILEWVYLASGFFLASTEHIIEFFQQALHVFFHLTIIDVDDVQFRHARQIVPLNAAGLLPVLLYPPF